MKRRESPYPEDWFRVGRRELKRAGLLLDGGDQSGAGFNIHQAVEKHLKGYLLSRGWRLRRIHDLEALLNEAIRHDEDLDRFRAACLKMNQYYLEERYPFTVASELTTEEVSQSLDADRELIRKLTGSPG